MARTTSAGPPAPALPTAAGATSTLGTSTWPAELTRTLRSVGRMTHSIRLYDAMGARAGLHIRPYLYSVLARIRDLQPVRISDVADRMDYDRSTVSRHVAELVNLGCVARHPEPTDGRVVILQLTETGERAVEQVVQAWMGFLTEITGDWSPEDRELFVELLQRFDRSLAQHLADL